MKIKIKDFNGIFTNIDENDNRLELVRDSENFLHRPGYLELEPRNLAEDLNVPDPNADLPNYTWTWETGIYTTLSSDLLTTKDVPVPSKHDVLVLIAKAIDSGTYHRLIYMYDITEGGPWYELSRYGNYIQVSGYPVIDIINHNTTNFDLSYFSTTIDGTVHFQVEDGRLKLYFPHDTFWLGKIDRKLWFTDHKHRWPVTLNGVTTYPHVDYEQDYWYLDRIVDAWDHTRQTVLLDTIATHQTDIPPNADFTTMWCAQPDDFNNEDYRRTGLYYQLGLETDTSTAVGSRPVTMGAPHDALIRAEEPFNDFRCIRLSITDTESGAPVRNPDLPYPIYPEIWLWKVDAINSSGIPPWDATPADYPNIYIHFTESLAELFKPEGTTWDALTSYTLTPNGYGHVWRNTIPVVTSSLFSISLQDFYAQTIEYSGDQTIADIGWGVGDDKFAIAVTMLLDDREEIPVHVQRVNLKSITGNYALSIKNIQIPWNINKRITRLRFYHNLFEGADFDMIKEFDLLESGASIEEFMFSAEDYTGTTLASNIGFLWDYYERQSDLKIVNGFSDFTTDNGISIGLSSRDEVGVYHSTYGGGNLMPDLIYDDNRLPLTGVSTLSAVANADGRLMVFSDNTAYVIHAQEINGVIGFRFEDTVELGVKNKFDIANIQGGVVVHTQHGIYITNGYQTQLVSAPIDDIIVANYSTGRVYYNKYLHEILYKPTDSEDLYRLRLKDSVWERIDKTITTTAIESEYEDAT